MIKMNVMGIAIDTRTGSPIVVLKDEHDRRALPIWIGSAEASAIIRKIEKMPVTRPMTHDLICTIIDDLDWEVSKIEIHDVEKETYFATVVLSKEGEEDKLIDARPSDAIAIAIRAKADIYVTANVVASGTISTDKEKEAQESEEFKEFVKDIKPSDFQKLLDEHRESDQ